MGMSTSQPDAGTNRPDRHIDTTADLTVGPETWVREAIAEQEEHIKRWRSCMDTLGRSHAYTTVTPDSEGLKAYRACRVCGVTQTREDYARMRGTDVH